MSSASRADAAPNTPRTPLPPTPAGTTTLPRALRQLASWRDCTQPRQQHDDHMCAHGHAGAHHQHHAHGPHHLQRGMLRPQEAVRRNSVVLLQGSCADDCHHSHGDGLRPHDAAAEEVQELPKCCQQALDLDEPIGAVKAMVDRGQDAHAGHQHSGWLSRLHGAWDWAGAVFTGYAAFFGIWFGAQNLRNSLDVLSRLKAISQRVKARIDAIVQPEGGRPVGEVRKHDLERLDRGQRTAVRNLAAQDNALRAGSSMQRFISVFAGALPIISSTVMLCGVVVPPLALVGTGLLALYCMVHAIRYAVWDRARANQPLPAAAAADNDDTYLVHGRKIYTEKQSQRRYTFKLVAGWFGVYGVGAAAFVLAGVVPFLAPFLLIPSMVLLGLGMLVVTRLNNVSIRKAFINNQNVAIDREHLGSKASILRQIAAYDQECAALQDWSKQDAPRERWLPWLGEAALTVLSYATVMGLNMGMVNRLRHRRRVADYSDTALHSLGTFIRASCDNKIKHLDAELGEVQRRMQNGTPADNAAFAKTRVLLAGWKSAEQDLQRSIAQAHNVRDTADYIWNFLQLRDMLDDMTIATTTHLSPKASWGTWWRRTGGHVELDREAWLQALSANDPEAVRQLHLLCGEMAHTLKHKYEETLKGRQGSLIDQLGSRLQEKAARRRSA